MEVYLIRHGESKGNIAQKLQGCQDFELTMNGKRQAVLLGEYFSSIRLNYIYSSDLSRAYTTAKALEKHQLVKTTAWENLREIYLGPLEGKTRQQIYDEFPGVKNKNLLQSGLEGTETDAEITARCGKLYSLLEQLKKEEKMAVISHGGFLSIFLMYLLAGKQWYTLHRPFRLDNTGVTKLSWSKKELSIHYINRCTHLINDK